ncbi:hypothetical protein NB520_23035 [Vibrio antiquarius]|uniref:hypothetical protein n=1 Tax=Vibrio antiquarius (strain Ex25) TaxID=150340 RepID=UPI00265817C4|nr:hypothetical protein [Vibrio antiquarius]MCR9628124.1 hypothetical protein [Vibrio antiquarius]MCR9634357.1 hypothetical protein [Vibrio antiquarius]
MRKICLLASILMLGCNRSDNQSKSVYTTPNLDVTSSEVVRYEQSYNQSTQYGIIYIFPEQHAVMAVSGFVA